MADASKVVDGSVRGMIFAALSGILHVVVRETGIISDDSYAELLPAILFLSFVAGGFYDAYIRPRLQAPPS